MAQAPAPVTPAPAPSGAAAVQARQTILKGWGDALRPVGPMLRGEAPYQAEPVRNALQLIVNGSTQLPNLFPPDSNGVANTKALPVIWERKNEFTAIYAKINADASAALAGITDEASFKARMPTVLANCGACHNQFRAR